MDSHDIVRENITYRIETTKNFQNVPLYVLYVFLLYLAESSLFGEWLVFVDQGVYVSLAYFWIPIGLIPILNNSIGWIAKEASTDARYYFGRTIDVILLLAEAWVALVASVEADRVLYEVFGWNEDLALWAPLLGVVILWGVSEIAFSYVYNKSSERITEEKDDDKGDGSISSESSMPPGAIF
jgi:hypothetical protein